jgi:hypothetical protein
MSKLFLNPIFTTRQRLLSENAVQLTSDAQVDEAFASGDLVVVLDKPGGGESAAAFKDIQSLREHAARCGDAKIYRISPQKLDELDTGYEHGEVLSWATEE